MVIYFRPPLIRGYPFATARTLRINNWLAHSMFIYAHHRLNTPPLNKGEAKKGRHCMELLR